MTLTENERRILNQLAVCSPLSKRDITERGGMGWATAVKLISRLEEQGYVVPYGNERQNQAGKSATVYALAPNKPVALGIDIEYVRARVQARNLSGECLFEAERGTPEFATPDDLIAFLDALLHDAAAGVSRLGIALEGAGIGVPSHLFGHEGVAYARIAEELAARCAFPVIVDNNIRCFTASIASREQFPVSMLVVTIRSGIGVGIVIDGSIYQGERGCSGEIGHLPAVRDGLPCRCGKTGCLETVVNRAVLATDLHAGACGDRAAQQRVQAATELLGRAIAAMMLVLDIRRVAVYAELGEYGSTLQEPLRRAVGEVVNPGFDFNIRYQTLDAQGYVVGAAQLILDEFLLR